MATVASLDQKCITVFYGDNNEQDYTFYQGENGNVSVKVTFAGKPVNIVSQENILVRRVPLAEKRMSDLTKQERRNVLEAFKKAMVDTDIRINPKALVKIDIEYGEATGDKHHRTKVLIRKVSEITIELY